MKKFMLIALVLLFLVAPVHADTSPVYANMSAVVDVTAADAVVIADNDDGIPGDGGANTQTEMAQHIKAESTGVGVITAAVLHRINCAHRLPMTEVGWRISI